MAIDNHTQCITFPSNFCKITASKDELINELFSNFAQNYNIHEWLRERAILAVKNNDVNVINFCIQDAILGKTTRFKSIDTVMNQDEDINYPTEFLNSFYLPVMPPYILTLKIGVPIILLRNIKYDNRLSISIT